MVRKARGNRRNFRRRRRLPRSTVTESMISDISIGTSTAITGKHLSNVPKHSIWKPISLVVQVAGYSSGIQVMLCGPDGQYVNSSRVQLVDSTKRRVRVFYPRNADWYVPLDQHSPTQIAVINSVCTLPYGGKDPLKLGVVVEMRIALKSEIVSIACPVALVEIETISAPLSPCSSFAGL